MTDSFGVAEQPDAARLARLLDLAILDTASEREFDDIVRLAAFTCGAGGAALTLIDRERAWFKAGIGVNVPEVARRHALCALDIDLGDFLLVPDTSLDARCRSDPLLAGPAPARFYAGAPLLVGSGHCVGRLCVFDRAPRDGLAEEQRRALTSLARMAVDLMEAHRLRRAVHAAAKVAEVISDAILCADDEGRITFWNPAAEAMFGRSAAEAIGAPLDIIVPAAVRQSHRSSFLAAAAGGAMALPVAAELIALRADGTTFPVELTRGRWYDGDRPAFAAIIRDATARKRLEGEREQARQFLDTVIENVPAMLFVKEAASQRYLLMNKAGAELTGRAQADFVGRTDGELFPGPGDAYQARDRSVAEGRPGVHIFESDHVREDGQRFSLRTKRLVIEAPGSAGRYLVGMTEDVTEARLAQAEVRRLADYDSLTGLRNRAGFVSLLDQFVRAELPFALVGIDLDRFKAINDQFGHLAGDEVIATIAARLREQATLAEVVARVGGDEFVMILPGETAPERAGVLAPAIIAALQAPVETARVRAFVGASIGIASFPRDGSTPVELRQAVDLALYRAKERGRGTICFYSEDLDAGLREQRYLEHALREALDGDAVELAFQPVISLGSREITSFEALARWTHPQRGPIAPTAFIAVAEECGLIEALGSRILHKACAEAMTWPAHLRVAVNLSPAQFGSGRLGDVVRDALAATGLPADRLQLEVTEGLLIRDVEPVFAQLEHLRRSGIQILMDDFGTGYSSLSYFQRFRFDNVKIDRSFVERATTAPAALAIIKAVVELGQTLGISVVAEGVETEQQLELLTSLGCTHVQGYLTGRPMPGHEVHRLLHASKADALERKRA